MTTIHEIIRAAKPEASDEFCEHIIWGRTPYPVGRVTPKALYKAASGYVRAYRKNTRLCELCHRIVTDQKRYVCDRCESVLTKNR